MDIKKEYERWLENATADANVAAELKTLDNAKIEDAFYRDLAFGTGGLRGVIGAGTNRMNIYTVAKASQGLADYLKKNFAEPSVAIGYDSRIKSDVFAKVAAGVFAANGVKVNIWPVLMPVPTVSFATRYLHTSAGVMVTASHNPSKYNGYKVYGADGCQITTEAAAEILAEIEKLDIFADVKHSNFETGLVNGSMVIRQRATVLQTSVHCWKPMPQTTRNCASWMSLWTMATPARTLNGPRSKTCSGNWSRGPSTAFW